MDLGDDATGYSECGEGSGPTCPQSGRAALEGGSEDSCLPEGTEGSGGYVPAERGLETIVRHYLRARRSMLQWLMEQILL